MLDSLYSGIGRLLGIEGVSGIQWRLGNGLPPTLLAAILIGALFFAFWSYRRENVSQRKNLLVVLRLSGIFILLIVLLQPSVSLQHEEEGRSRVFIIVDRSKSMMIQDDGETSRWNKAITALTETTTGLLSKLGSRHEVELLTVGDQVNSSTTDTLADELPEAESSAIGLSLDSLREEDLTAVVLLSDMAWNAGDDPVNIAAKLGARGVRVFPVPIGQSNSPDAAILAVHLRDRIFPGEEILLKVQLNASPQLEGMSTLLSVTLDGNPIVQQPVVYKGGQQMLEIPIKGPELKGRIKLSLELEPLEQEVTETNNREDRFVTFIEQKVKVLYVEGAPRWEYRYLRTVLMRDPRLDVKFLMTEGDPDLADYSPEYIGSFPVLGETEADFDLVILGDVPSSYFTQQQMEWMVQQVNRLGGSLLMLGGSLHAPQTYGDSPIAPLLPVKIEGDSWEVIPNDVVISPTEEGLSGKIATLGVEQNLARKLWAQVSPLYDAPPVSAKPGASVLVTLGRKQVQGRPYPLVTWQRYGTGKSMFVGTELLWRLRKTVGRQHHEKFWSTTIQFMALSRVLGGSGRITLEVDGTRYASGESVRLHADVLDDYLEPVLADDYAVMVRKSDDSEFEPIELELRPALGSPGFFQGYYLPPSSGDYEIKAIGSDEAQANIARFSVYEESIEMRRPEMRIDTAEQIAIQSSGEVVPVEEIVSLAEKIEQRRPRYQREISIRVWDHPALYLLLLLVAGWEWWLRRRLRLV